MATPTLLNITAAGWEGASAATIQSSGESYAASIQSGGIGGGSGLVIWITDPSASSFALNTWDAYPFQDASGQALSISPGQSVCIANSSASPVLFTVNLGSGPLSTPLSSPSPVAIAPGQSISFALGTPASSAVSINTGCLAPVNPQPLPLQPNTWLYRLKEWLSANKEIPIAVSVGIFVFIVFLITKAALHKKQA